MQGKPGICLEGAGRALKQGVGGEGCWFSIAGEEPAHQIETAGFKWVDESCLILGYDIQVRETGINHAFENGGAIQALTVGEDAVTIVWRVETPRSRGR